MHNQRAFLVVTAAAGVLSAFLPWISAPFVGSVAGTDGTDGWLVVGVFAIAAVVAFSGGPVVQAGRRLAIALLGIVGGGIAVWKISDVYDMKSHASDGSRFGNALGNAIGVGTGLWLMAASAIALVVLSMRRAAAVSTTGLIAAPPAAPVPACATCSAPTVWVQEHQRFFCSRCNQYA